MNIQVKPLEEFLQQSKCDTLQFFRIIGIFLNFDSSMPLALKKHFMELEIDLVSRIAWKDDAAIMLYSSALDSGNGKENRQVNSRGLPVGPGPENISIELMFFNRVLIYAATQMYHLCTGLPISDELMEYIWAVLKYILTQRVDLLKNRHLDQMIFCTIYCVSKIFKLQLKFQEIINK